jgi:hypothetical protein
MSNESKQQLGEVLTWVLRSLTAIGAFFLIGIYGEIKENTKLLRSMQIEYAADKAANNARFTQIERDMERVRSDRFGRIETN